MDSSLNDFNQYSQSIIVLPKRFALRVMGNIILLAKIIGNATQQYQKFITCGMYFKSEQHFNFAQFSCHKQHKLTTAGNGLPSD